MTTIEDQLTTESSITRSSGRSSVAAAVPPGSSSPTGASQLAAAPEKSNAPGIAGPALPQSESVDKHEDGHDWQEAGRAWGHRAVDWACLYEHYATEVIAAMFNALDVGDGASLLDVACGSGLAIQHAVGRGAEAAGIDAATALVEIARVRNPDSDIRVGSMFELPWEANSFDAAVSVNGIWGDCVEALEEMHRVVKPRGRVAFSYWGKGKPLDLRDVFVTFALHSPETHLEGMRKTNNISRDGVAEEMLDHAGFDLVEAGSRISTVDWPDAETAWRALSSIGPAYPALQHSDRDVLRSDVLAALEACRDEFGIYRLRNEHRYVVAEARR